MEKLGNDLVELTLFEAMRRVLEPVTDDLPDPTVTFEAFTTAMLERVERTVFSLPYRERPAYFLERARESLRWCGDNRAPEVMTERVRRWLARLQREQASAPA